MGRITSRPPIRKPKFVHEARVGHEVAKQAWLWEEAARIAGHASYKRRTPFLPLAWSPLLSFY
jgi:hypothetical protein